MKINYVNKTRDSQYRDYINDFNRVMETTLNHLKLGLDYEIACIILRDRGIKKINREYRNIDNTTDVISFANIDYEQELISELGDVFINVEAASRQAIDYSHSLRREMSFLFLHGLLHCLGYDHGNIDDENKMFSLQKVIMKELDDIYGKI